MMQHGQSEINQFICYKHLVKYADCRTFVKFTKKTLEIYTKEQRY